jgi:hypothetical protein
MGWSTLRRKSRLSLEENQSTSGSRRAPSDGFGSPYLISKVAAHRQKAKPFHVRQFTPYSRDGFTFQSTQGCSDNMH